METFHRRLGEACSSAFTEIRNSTKDVFTEPAKNVKQNINRFHQTCDYYIQGEVPALTSITQSISDMTDILAEAKEKFAQLFLKDRFTEFNKGLTLIPPQEAD